MRAAPLAVIPALFVLWLPSIASAAEDDGGGRFLPTLAVAVGKDQDEALIGNGWLGVAAFPSSDALTPFFAAGAEVDVRSYESPDERFTTALFGPQLRAGVSWFPDANEYLSAMNVYALGGYQAPSVFHARGAARFGAGVSSPLLGIAMLGLKIPVPWMAEVTADVSAEGTAFAWRVGFAY